MVQRRQKLPSQPAQQSVQLGQTAFSQWPHRTAPAFTPRQTAHCSASPPPGPGDQAPPPPAAAAPPLPLDPLDDAPSGACRESAALGGAYWKGCDGPRADAGAAAAAAVAAKKEEDEEDDNEEKEEAAAACRPCRRCCCASLWRPISTSATLRSGGAGAPPPPLPLPKDPSGAGGCCAI